MGCKLTNAFIEALSIWVHPNLICNKNWNLPSQMFEKNVWFTPQIFWPPGKRHLRVDFRPVRSFPIRFLKQPQTTSLSLHPHHEGQLIPSWNLHVAHFHLPWSTLRIGTLGKLAKISKRQLSGGAWRKSGFPGIVGYWLGQGFCWGGEKSSGSSRE